MTNLLHLFMGAVCAVLLVGVASVLVIAVHDLVASFEESE